MRRGESDQHEIVHDRALRRVRRTERGRPGLLAWCAGLGIHAAVAFLLVL